MILLSYHDNPNETRGVLPIPNRGILLDDWESAMLVDPKNWIPGSDPSDADPVSYEIIDPHVLL